MRLTILVSCGVLFLLSLGSATADGVERLQPDKKEKCPVCGMFVYKYPDWVARIVHEDGRQLYFDGAKDLFKYYLQPEKYEPNRGTRIRSIEVTEYYDMRPMDAKGAFYVIGGDILGPMGKELIPFQSLQDAQAFKQDHGGTQILTFDQVKLAVIATLD
jgi:copper chaperone NosL